VFAEFKGVGNVPLQEIKIPISINGFNVFGFIDVGASHTFIDVKWGREHGLQEEPVTVKLGLAVKGVFGNASVRFPKVQLVTSTHGVEVDAVGVDLPNGDSVAIALGRDVLSLLGISIHGLPHEFPDLQQDATDVQDMSIIIEEMRSTVKRLQIPSLTDEEKAVSELIKQGLDNVLQLNSQLPKDSFCKLPESEVTLDTGDHPPCAIPQYRIPERLIETVTQKVEEWAQQGVIERAPVGCPWNFPLLAAPKKDLEGKKTKVRVCIDVRRLNLMLVDNPYPLPVIRHVLLDLDRAKLFTVIDLADGYHHFKIKQEHRMKTAFTWMRIKWMFARAPFGIKSLPALFQHIMDIILGDLPFVRVYLDDILILSCTVQEHIEHVSIVVERLTAAGFQLRLPKCTFGVPRLKLLGNVVGPEGVMPDVDKVLTIVDWPVPRSLKDLQSFLGLINYFSAYIPRYSSLCAPLNALRSKKGSKTFTWENWPQDKVDALNILKLALVNCLKLSYPDFSKPFVLATDASQFGIGGVLYQRGEKDEILFIEVMSRSLSNSEQNYCITKLELLAVVYCLERCQYYLWGRKFTLETDHRALIFMLSQKNLNPMLMRWYDRIMEFTFDVVHIAGIKHVLPDALSRLFPDYTKEGCRAGKIITFFQSSLAEDSYKVMEEWRLNPQLFRELQVKFGKHTLDAFATKANAQLPTFGSAVGAARAYKKGRCVGKALSVSWKGHNVYAFPPVRLLEAVVQKVRKDECWATVVTPADASIPGFKLLQDLSARAPLLYKHQDFPVLFLSCKSGYWHWVEDIPWKATMVWRLVGNDNLRPPLAGEALTKFKRVTVATVNSSTTLEQDTQCQECVPESHTTAVERKHKIWLCHLQGHFGITEVVKKLQEEGESWPHMVDDVKGVICSCAECAMHKKERPFYHKSLPVDAILPMDHLAIDTHTMPVVSNGMVVILSVIDLATRFVWIRSMPDKLATTIAKTLWEIFSNFGIPRVIQSDNGTEFVNKVLKALVDVMCIDHRLTTAYHPRANGAVERSFSTIVTMLNKFVQGAKRDWSFHVPQVQLWMNLHVNARYGSTPFSVMFNRPFVGFKDHSQVPLGEMTPEMLSDRYKYAAEILFPATAAMSKLTSARRKAIFNAKVGVKDDPFPVGAYVMLRNQRCKTKMDANYIGPFIIRRRTRGGTYVLQDLAGDLFPRNAAPSQLKLVSATSEEGLLGGEENHFTVDRIINHRGQPGKYFYKVRWTGYGPADDTWEPAQNVHANTIADYWNRTGQHNPQSGVVNPVSRSDSDMDTEEDVE
jgi:transposase InsO family protein